nr:choline transport protein [Quercus suber]
MAFLEVDSGAAMDSSNTYAPTATTGSKDSKNGTGNDRRDMIRMGKRQELRRNFQFFSIWGYAVILGCTWEWGLASGVFSLTNGGTAGAIWMFLAVCFGMFFVMLRWFALLGWQTSLVGTAYAAGQQFEAMIALSNPTYVIKGWHGCLFTIGLTAVSIIFNTALYRNLPLIEVAIPRHLQKIARVNSLRQTIMFTIGTDVDEVLSSRLGVPWVQIFYNATNSYAATMTLTCVVGVLITCCLINNVTTSSRQLWSFARDGGVPFSSFFAKVSAGWDVPVNAMAFTLAITVVLSLFIIGSPVAFSLLTSLSLTGLISSYLLAVTCVLSKRIRGETFPPGRFNLGKFGLICNSIAVAFLLVAFAFVVFGIDVQLHCRPESRRQLRYPRTTEEYRIRQHRSFTYTDFRTPASHRLATDSLEAANSLAFTKPPLKTVHLSPSSARYAVFMQRYHPADCLRYPLSETLPTTCQQLKHGYGECKRGMIDMRKRFRGNKPISTSQELEAGGGEEGTKVGEGMLYAGGRSYSDVKGTDGREDQTRAGDFETFVRNDGIEDLRKK